MNELSKKDLEILLGKEGEPSVSVSIFMPVQKKGSGIQENPIRLKNLLRSAEDRLVETGLRRPDARALLAPASELQKDGLFWQRSDGLAMFISPGLFRYYRVPLDFKELVVVANRFHIKPLLPMLSTGGKFYVLALSQKAVKLLQCTPYGTREVDLVGLVPGNLAEVLKYDEIQRRESHHMGVPELGKAGAVFHGKDISQTAKTNILRYFQQVDAGMRHRLLTEENAPLILAAVDYLHPIYKKANTYRYLFDQGITGNPDDLSSGELQKRAWGLAQPFFERAQAKAVAEYRQLAGTGHTSNDILEIIPGAYAGNIELLFVALGVEQWGTYDPTSNTVDLNEKAAPRSEDLLDLAAVHVLIHGGTVYAVSLENVPGASPVAAVFRHERHHPQAHQAGTRG